MTLRSCLVVLNFDPTTLIKIAVYLEQDISCMLVINTIASIVILAFLLTGS